MIAGDIIDTIRGTTGQMNSLVHGLQHWRTVVQNGLYLASFGGANPLIAHFMYFHDCMRRNENRDGDLLGSW